MTSGKHWALVYQTKSVQIIYSSNFLIRFCYSSFHAYDIQIYFPMNHLLLNTRNGNLRTTYYIHQTHTKTAICVALRYHCHIRVFRKSMCNAMFNISIPFSCWNQMGTSSNKRVSQMRAPLTARREAERDQNRPPNVQYNFENKT